jgi:hypothetical protein
MQDGGVGEEDGEGGEGEEEGEEEGLHLPQTYFHCILEEGSEAGEEEGEVVDDDSTNPLGGSEWQREVRRQMGPEGRGAWEQWVRERREQEEGGREAVGPSVEGFEQEKG